MSNTIGVISKPDKYTRYASDPYLSTVIEPSSGKKDVGWVFEEKPPASYFNWLHSNAYKWENFFSEILKDLFDAGTWGNTPTINYGGGSSFDISDFMVVSRKGFKLDFPAGTFTLPYGGLTPNITTEFRTDAIVIEYDDTNNQGTYKYIVDILSTGFTNTQYALGYPVVAKNAAYELEEILTPPRLKVTGTNEVLVADGRGSHIGSDLIGLIGVQSAIDTLAGRSGGVVKLIGDYFGRVDYHFLTGYTIKMKSGVTVKGLSNNLITAPINYGATIEPLFTFEGFTDAGTLKDTNHLVSNAGENFKDYGLLSLVEILAPHVDAGFYLIEETLNDVAANDMVKLQTLQHEDVSFTLGACSFITYIFRAGLENLRIDITGASFNANSSNIIRLKYTYDTIFKDVKVFNYSTGLFKIATSAFNMIASYIYNTTFQNVKIYGNFVYGIKANDVGATNENINLFNVDIDVETIYGGIVSKAVDLVSSGANNGIVSGCRFLEIGTSTFLTNMGFKGYPETVDHNTNGTHGNDIIGTSQLVDDSVTNIKMHDDSVGEDEIINNSISVFKMQTNSVSTDKIINDSISLIKMKDDSVGENEIVSSALGNGLTGGSGALVQISDWVITLKEMISSKDDASAAAVMAIQQERGTIIYDGIGSFSWANFDKWHVRKAAGTGAYEIGIPGKVDGTDIMTPTWPEGKLLFTLTSLQHPRFGRVHDYTGNGGLPFVWSYYSIHFKDDAGNDANSNFELAITRAVES